MALTKEGIISICNKVVEQKDTITDLTDQLIALEGSVEFLNDPEIIAAYNAALAIIQNGGQ